MTTIEHVHHWKIARAEESVGRETLHGRCKACGEAREFPKVPNGRDGKPIAFGDVSIKPREDEAFIDWRQY